MFKISTNNLIGTNTISYISVYSAITNRISTNQIIGQFKLPLSNAL